MTKLTLYIYIDKYLIGFIINLINFILFLSDKIINKNKSNLDSSYQNIIIIKFLGIGSISRSINLIQQLKKTFPKAKVTFITFTENKQFIDLINIIENVQFVEKRNFLNLIFTTLKLFLNNIFLKKNTLLIDLESHSNFSKLLSFFSGANYKIGYFISKKNQIYDKLFYFDRLDFIESNYFKILNYFNIQNQISLNLISLLNLSNEKIEIDKKLQDVNILENEKFFVLNINASDLCVERKWDVVNFKNLALKILQNNYKIILTGTNKEKMNTDLIINDLKEYKNKIFNFAGLTTVGELICLLANYSIVFISNDSGPLHLANISKCATVSLWGPGDPVHYAEKYSKHVIIYKKVYCSPCIYMHIRPPCKGNNICMQEIGIDEVFSESINLIEKL